jgi:hypothetical protein
MRWATMLGVTLSAAGALAVPSVANACGGCFGPTETQQVVTDHRMVMAIHQDRAILWDQIRYSGRPEDFSWVLPVSGDVQVRVASGAFFDTLDSTTAVRVQGPFINQSCPGAGGALRGFAASAPNAEDSTTPPPVEVLRQEVVGPYDTVLLRSTDGDALTAWLRDNHYVIPRTIEPTIQYYTGLHMDFVALRLRPGQGVGAMQPIRIEYRTANTVLPLRMVAAGIADKVGILLWVFGSGRYEAMNFANGAVDPQELVWNWDTNSSNYTSVFDATLRRLNGGRAWLTEYAMPSQNLRWQFDAQSRGTAMADEMSADWNLATRNNSPDVWITRLRTDLSIQYLDNDLQLRAAADNQTMSNNVRTTGEVGTRPVPRCPSTPNVGVGGGSLTCSAAAGRVGMPTARVTTIALLAGGLVVVVARRRRRSRRDGGN